MKLLRSAVVMALSLTLAVGAPFADARPTQSSSSFKGGVSSQKSSPARSSNTSRNTATAPSRGNGSFGSFGARRTQDAAPPPSSSGNRSAMSRDMSQQAARDNAVRSMDSRNAANTRPLPPLDPVLPRQPQDRYGNQGSQGSQGSQGRYGSADPAYRSSNSGYNSPQYDNRRYDNGNVSRSGNWGTAGAAAAGAVIGSVITGGAHAGNNNGAQQAPAPAPLPGNVPEDVGAIGPVEAAGPQGSIGPMADNGTAAVQEAAPAEARVRKESSGMGWFGWAVLALIGYAVYRMLARRKSAKRGPNYSLGD